MNWIHNLSTRTKLLLGFGVLLVLLAAAVATAVNSLREIDAAQRSLMERDFVILNTVSELRDRQVRVVPRWQRARKPAPAVAPSPVVSPDRAAFTARDASLLLVGALLAKLPRDLPVPVIVVQHIAPGFLAGIAGWLQQVTGWPVGIARHGERPLPGHVYLAPDHCHLGVNGAGLLTLSNEPPEGGHRPAVSRLFRSVAEGPLAPRSVAVLLTGMGVDGAAELRRLRDRGALTIAQDAESSVVHGMPGEAIRLGAAVHVLPPESIAFLLRDCGRRPPPSSAVPA
jgi:two-component system chemotaxis response regulator CheB